MDAKPQRPVRSVRVRGDENLPPTAVAGNKTIHQRNKSSPALSTMLGATGLKAAAKRTAFGDVSNTVGATRPYKDDSSIPAKDGIEITEKSIQLQQDNKSAALLRPAQRPLSVSGLKGLLNSVTHPNSREVLVKHVPVATAPTSQPANTRKVLTKRNTTVFKDSALPPVEEAGTTTRKENISVASTALVRQPLIPLMQTTQQPQILNVQKHVSIESSKHLGVDDTKEERQHDPPTLTGSDGLPALRSDGVYIDDNGEVQVYQELPLAQDEQEKLDTAVNNAKILEQGSEDICQRKLLDQEIDKASCAVDRSSIVHHHNPPLAESEEYWEDEDEENYDEEGYVTARSYRSRGENTTGGATTMGFPKVTQKVRKELAAAKQLVEATRTEEEIEDEWNDSSMVAEYGDEIFQYMRDLEIKMLPNAHYMDNQAEIQWSMRSVLMDWLVQVHHRFSLLPETLFLCVNYIDRFLSCKIVSLGKLQLVGATAIFIAAKYEEINCPSVQEIVYMVDGGYTVDEILKAERFMLSMLQFELGWPGPMSFLRRISKADDYDLETRTLAKYFLEITIMDERFVGSPPSFAAAGAHCLARLMLKKGAWSPVHVYYSNYTYPQLQPLVTLILECCESPQKHHLAVFDKYCDKRYKRASLFVEAELKRDFRIHDVSQEMSTAPLGSLVENGSSWRRR